NRQPDPGRPRALDDPDPDQQPEEDQRARRLWSDRGRAGADRDPAPRREPALPRDKTQQARTSPAPPGPPLRDGAGGMSEGVEETRFWPPPDDEEESEAQSGAEPAA